MRERILEILRNQEGFVSGQDLCELLHVSRTAVWKVIKQLRDDGYVIEAVNNRGYRMLSSPDIISEEELLSLIDTEEIGRHVKYFDAVGSTNNEAKLLAERNAPHGTLVAAGLQTAGKGRRGRIWSSPAGAGIFMSLILKPPVAPKNASMLTLVAAMAVSEAILGKDVPCQIKWPNDVIVGSKKICGILTEMSADMDNINYVVVGIGINVNTQEFPPEIEAVATSLLIEKKQPFKRAEVIRDVISAFEKYYKMYLLNEDMSLLKEQYNEWLVNIHRQVRIVERENTYVAVARGINERGELIVEADGREQLIASGEVSVRGILGYV